METPRDSVQTVLLGALAERGLATSTELQRASGKSQPTVSRALRGLSKQLVTLGRGKSTRYGLPQPIRGLPSQQDLWWTDPQGQTHHFGTLTLLAGERLHVSAEGIDELTHAHLPWFLSPLRLQGFLGREWALRLGLEGGPERWSLEQVLYAALCIDDHPGAISLGEPQAERQALEPVDTHTRAMRYDLLAADVAATLPAGSSAGGEQSKFLSRLASGERVLVKFTPQRDTPFGERWHDLLHAECLALQLLAEHGFATAGHEGARQRLTHLPRINPLRPHRRAWPPPRRGTRCRPRKLCARPAPALGSKLRCIGQAAPPERGRRHQRAHAARVWPPHRQYRHAFRQPEPVG